VIRAASTPRAANEISYRNPLSDIINPSPANAALGKQNSRDPQIAKIAQLIAQAGGTDL